MSNTATTTSRAPTAVTDTVRTVAGEGDVIDFSSAVDALITWGRRSTRARTKPRRSIKLGSYSASERLIRVHPVLDKPWVPRYFVSYIVYHEMLHHVIPSSQGSGRRMLHPPLFQERERLFRDFERSLAWERAHIGRLLRAA